MARYGRGAQKSVERAMHKRKHGTLTSGRSGKKVRSRKQAIAIGLSEAREKGAKVPSRGRSSAPRSRRTESGARARTGSRRSGGSRGKVGSSRQYR